MNSKKKISYRRKKEELELFPNIWDRNLGDEAVFSFVAYSLPVADVIAEILRRYVDDSRRFQLSLSSRYLNNFRTIFPGYYSDRERIIVILNRFKKQNRDWPELFSWISFLSENKRHPYIHFFLGVIFLDKYLRHLDQAIWIDKSIDQLLKALKHIQQEECKNALNSLLAFAYYMKGDMNQSLKFIKSQGDDLSMDFQDLIKDAA